MYYSHKKFIGDIVEVEDDGILHTELASIPVKKGEIIFKPFDSHAEILSKDYFEKNYVPVEVKKKPKIDIEVLMQGYIEMGELIEESNKNNENYIFEVKK